MGSVFELGLNFRAIYGYVDWRSRLDSTPNIATDSLPAGSNPLELCGVSQVRRRTAVDSTGWGGRYRFLHDALRQHFVGSTPVAPPLIQRSNNSWLGYILLGLGLFLVVVLGNSIYTTDSRLESAAVPTVQSGDLVFSDIVTHRWRDFQRGDVIRFWVDEQLAQQGFNYHLDYIMRIVGLPGETFEIQKGQVYINSQLLQADYIDALPTHHYDKVEIEIPPQHYLVIGTDPDDSDSLWGGLVVKGQISGKVLFRLWPPRRFGIVE